ncbi:MAG: hypothetical protein HY717_02275 [Planctomycetes bacterium]|nr:hypothetical protein [Planctomycetota bacterium]
MSAERAASLDFYCVPDPKKFSELSEAFERAADPGERQRLALAIAAAQDAMLAKEPAFTWLERAIEASPAAGGEDRLRAAREITGHGIAVYHELAGRWVARLGARFPDSPLVQAMREELSAFEAREAERLSGYLWRTALPVFPVIDKDGKFEVSQHPSR